MIANGGLGFVRLDFTWSEIERQQGTYDFSVQVKLIKALGEHGIRVLAILDYSNRLYDKSWRLASDWAPYRRDAASIRAFRWRCCCDIQRAWRDLGDLE